MGAKFSAPVQTGPGAHPASCIMVTGSFPGVKSGRDVTQTPHPLLATWSKKSTAISVLPLWAVRPVQSLSACGRVHFTLRSDFTTTTTTTAAAAAAAAAAVAVAVFATGVDLLLLRMNTCKHFHDLCFLSQFRRLDLEVV